MLALNNNLMPERRMFSKWRAISVTVEICHCISAFIRGAIRKIEFTFSRHLKQIAQPEAEAAGGASAQRGRPEGEDGSRRSTDTAESAETGAEPEASDTLVPPASGQRQGLAFLVTDSWRLANKSLVVTEMSLPPSQESSSDSVFTDPEEVTGAAEPGKKDAMASSTSTEEKVFVDAKNHGVGSPLSPLLGECSFTACSSMKDRCIERLGLTERGIGERKPE